MTKDKNHGIQTTHVRNRRPRPVGPGAFQACPRRRNVVLQKSFGSPRITKDGVTVSKEIELPEPFENMGAKLVNMVASKTGDVAGDGTTTAVVLAEAIYL